MRRDRISQADAARWIADADRTRPLAAAIRSAVAIDAAARRMAGASPDDRRPADDSTWAFGFALYAVASESSDTTDESISRMIAEIGCAARAFLRDSSDLPARTIVDTIQGVVDGGWIIHEATDNVTSSLDDGEGRFDPDRGPFAV